MPRKQALIIRLLSDFLCEPTLPGEDTRDLAVRWLEHSALGREFTAYLHNEAGLIAMAANRLNASGDEDLREIALELGRAAERLWDLMGTPARQRE